MTAAVLLLPSRKRCAAIFLDDPPHLAKRGRFTPPPAAFAAHQQQAAALTDDSGVEEFAGAQLVEEMSADLADARARASAILKLIEAAELRKKVAELEATNYALAVRILGTDSCRFQAFRGPDVF